MKSRWRLSAGSLSPCPTGSQFLGPLGSDSGQAPSLTTPTAAMRDRPRERLPAACTRSPLLGLRLAFPPFAFFFFFFFFFKYQNPTHSRHTLPLSRCDASRICPQSEAASAGPALPGAHCLILPSASVPCRTDSRCVFSPAPERASKRLARRRAQGRGSSSPQTRPPRGRSELSVCVELRNRTEGGCPTGGGGESRSSWPAQRRRHLIRSAGCRFCKSPARCEHYVTSFP